MSLSAQILRQNDETTKISYIAYRVFMFFIVCFSYFCHFFSRFVVIWVHSLWDKQLYCDNMTTGQRQNDKNAAVQNKVFGFIRRHTLCEPYALRYRLWWSPLSPLTLSQPGKRSIYFPICCEVQLRISWQGNSFRTSATLTISRILLHGILGSMPLMKK